MEASDRPVTSESLRPTNTFQDGDQPIGPPCGAEEQLDDILKDAYLEIPVRPDSRRYLRFVADGQVYQFKALCFGLSTAPQVFTRVLSPVSVILHDVCVQILRYLDD